MSLTTDHRLLVALRREIVLWDPTTGARQSLARAEDGIALDDGRQPVNTMLEEADQALYAAKAAGRGGVLVREVDGAFNRR